MHIWLIALSGCAEEKEVPPLLEVSAESVDFGTVGAGSVAQQSVSLTNSGGGEIAILSLSLIEGEASVFGAERDGDTIGAGATLEVLLQFAPDAEQLYSGRFQLRSDDPASPSRYIALAGIGGPSEADNDGDGYSAATGDCDDGDGSVNPGAAESCDGRDNDCDGAIPGDEADADFDGWLVCEGDCDDAEARTFPGAAEVCDDADNDCDGAQADRADADGDGASLCDGDCDDSEPRSGPALPESCDGIDNDCSGLADDIDADGDGRSPCGVGGDCDDADPAAYPVVVDDSAPAGGSGTQAAPWREIGEALAGLDARCRSIQLMPGTYEAALLWEGGSLRISGNGGPGEVVLTPAAGARPVEVSGGDLTLESLTITGGDSAGDGGAAWVHGGALSLYDVIVSGNRCTGDGGGVAVTSGALWTEGCSFLQNTADDDGGAISVLSGDYTDDGSVFEDNTAIRGGGLQLEGSSVHMQGSRVSGNLASDRGGGVELVGGSGIALEGLELWLNRAGTTGGGISVVDVDDPAGVLRNCWIQDNEAAQAGGGISVDGSRASLVIANNTLLGNTLPSGSAPGEGAGIWIGADSGAGLYVWSNIIGWSDGGSGLWSGGTGASVAWNLAYATSSGTDYSLQSGSGPEDTTDDAGDNLTADPRLTAFTDDGDPAGDDPAPTIASPAHDSGPADGAGPAGYIWRDQDGTQNDRGVTGGQGER